jgi:exopolysaccharide biosynthesis polyprenyl glycosylphosphotransferase
LNTSVKRRSSHWAPGIAAWFLLDGLIAFAAMHAAFSLSPYIVVLGGGEPAAHFAQMPAALLFGLLTALTAHIFRLHDPLLPRQVWPMLIRCLGAAWLALAILGFLVFAVLYSRIGRYILTQALVYAPALMALTRVAYWQKSRQRKRRLLLLGAGHAGQLAKRLIKESGMPMQVVAFVDQKPELVGTNLGNNAVLGTQAGLRNHCLDLEIDEVVTCVGGKLSDEAMNQLMECLSLGVRVSDFSNFVERNFFQVPVENIRGEWFLHADLELAHPLYLGIKRGIDLVTALVGLVVASPLMILAALAIKLESRGPVFYSQVRAGLHNQSFRIWKLRSMRLDAEKEGPKWAEGGDDRITRVGKLLRLTRLDEVPQFWNILRGEMSVVGPRPERPEFVEQLGKEIPFFNQRHLVKPGLTGWAQINYGYGACTEDALNKLKYDLYYIKHASLGLDLQIILRTLGALMKGAR